MQFTVTGYNAFNSAHYKNRVPRSVKVRMVTSYEFELYPEDCQGGVTINGVDYTAKKGCFSLTKPGWRQQMRLPYKCYFFNIHTRDEVLIELLDRLPVYGVLWDMDEAVKVFHELLQVNDRNDPADRLLIDGCVCKLLNMLLRSGNGDGESTSSGTLSHRRMLQQVDMYIREHYMEEINLAELADMCSLHPNYFHRLYTAAFGQTPAQRLLSCRVGAAKIMLLTENCTMTDIANRCGFSSQPYFGYKFKEAMGMTPLQYRKKELSRK